MTWWDLLVVFVTSCVSWVAFDWCGIGARVADRKLLPKIERLIKDLLEDHKRQVLAELRTSGVLPSLVADPVLDRITAPAAVLDLTPIPWTKDLRPKPSIPKVSSSSPLPKVDVVIMTFTAAEHQALAQVLTPGHSAESWQYYTENFSAYEPHLTWKSPAKEARRLGEYAVCEFGGRTFLLFHSQLHPATDDVTMPLRMLWRQIITETGCSLAIDTGTAGGVGDEVVEGDVLITGSVQFNCSTLFADQPYAHQRFMCPNAPTLSEQGIELWNSLVAANAGRLGKIATRPPRLWLQGDDQFVDFFAFADAEDSYGIVKADPNTRMEEMDFGALALACQDLAEKAPVWVSSRCASDPQVPQMSSLAAEKKWAENVYQEDGGFAAVGSVIASALVGAGV